MEQIKTNLFLNYERQIGRQWKRKLLGSKGNNFNTAFTRRVRELLIPAAGEDASAVLEAISNAIYIEARRCNMSLSPYGHLDPVKFCIANTFIAMLMAEARRALGIAGHFEFANIDCGRTLCRAAGFDFDDILYGQNYTDYCSQYNKLVARVNNLMIPCLKLTDEWLEHRNNIYKDDEGERYSFYIYTMANYYELDTVATSATVGQLVFRDINSKIAHEGARGTMKLQAFLSEISALLARYEGDEDLVNFSTEAIKAGMSHLAIAPIPSTQDNFAKVDVSFIYSLDDVMSLENAKFVHPVNGHGNVPGSVAIEWDFSWDILEDPTTNKFSVGHVDLTISGTLMKHENTLPIAVPYNLGLNTTLSGNETFDISDRPIYTHAKIKSEEGLKALTRYIVSATPMPVSAVFSIVAGGNAYVTTDMGYSDTPVTQREVFTSTKYNNGDTKCLYKIDVFNTQMLVDIVAFSSEVDNGWCFPVILDFIYGNSATNVTSVMVRSIGMKARLYLYSITNNGVYPIIADYDYITSVSSDALSNFFIANAWNRIQIK